MWPLFLVPLIGLWRLLRGEPAARRLSLMSGAIAGALLLITGWLLPQYFAPVQAAAWVVLVWSALTLPSMLARHRGTVLLLLLALLYVANACDAWWTWARGHEPYLARERRAVEQSLRAGGRRDPILVPPDIQDAVYNHADIDAQDVIWARDLGPEANRALLRYYGDRVVWRLSSAGGRLHLSAGGTG